MYNRLMTGIRKFARLLTKNHTGIRLGSTTLRTPSGSLELHLKSENSSSARPVSNPSTNNEKASNDDFFDSFGKPTKLNPNIERVVI